MTITKHTPVEVPAEAHTAIDGQIARASLDLTRTIPPRWMRDWLDQTAWRTATTDERRQMAAEAQQRKHLSRAAETAAIFATGRILDAPTDRTRPGSSYVPCRNGCGRYIRHGKPALLKCGTCRPANTNPLVN